MFLDILLYHSFLDLFLTRPSSSTTVVATITFKNVFFFSVGHLHRFISMGEEKPDTLDFVKDFQEYLSQQTQHVNMISGSVSGVKEADELPAGN